MKAAFTVIGAVIFLAGSALADPIIVKQRALELRNQNNVRQGVASPAQPNQRNQPAQPTAPAASTAPSPLLQQSLARVRADLAAIKADSTVTAAQKLQLTTNLLASAQGPGKPSQTTVATLADSLAAAFAQKPLSEASRSRLVSELAVVFNPAKYSTMQMQAIYADIQAIFQANGLPRRDAVKIADQAKAVAAEAQR